MPTDPASIQTAPAPAARKVTREELIQLGQSARPWEFLPVALQALRVAPHDAGLRFLTAANFAKLGLVTPAREALAALPPEVAGNASTIELSRAIDQLPPDSLPPAWRIETCRGNVEALRERGVDLSANFEAWSRRAEEWAWFRALDGNIVRRAKPTDDPAAWIGLCDQMGAASRVAGKYLEVSDEPFPPPCILEGLNPPWLFLKLIEHTPRSKAGYQPRITVLQADPLELLEGLSLADLRAAIQDPRVVFFVGADAAGRLRADLHNRVEAQIWGPYILLPATRARVQPPADQILRAALDDSQAAWERLRKRARAGYANRDRKWWARRYAQATDGSGEPLRVLILTTRYSTYIQHASRDLASAFHEVGCEVELMIEPDACTIFAAAGYLRRFERLRPDLVVLINYTRANVDWPIPPEVPFVCWVQDAMQHQFDAAIGSRQSKMDFVVGQMFPELFEHFGYPRRNTMEMPIVVSTSKFHDGPVRDALLRRHACEIAYVGHQSETPEDQRDRIIHELSGTPVFQRCVEAAYPKIHQIATNPMQQSPALRLAEIVGETLREVSGKLDRRSATHLLRLFVQPMADRILRHQSLQWAAELAERHRWRFRIYGRGWDTHPHLARYACGELAHGEELRASYRAAAVHLHLSINTMRHQRVLECVLSGGLPICRRKLDDLWPIRNYTLDKLVRERGPVVCHVPTRKLGYAVVDHAAALSHTAALQRYGLPTGPFEHISADEIERRRKNEQPYLDHDDAWLLGDPAEITFASPQDLEQLVERAIERPAWRDSLSKSIAHRVRDRYTSERFARQVIDMVRASFA